MQGQWVQTSAFITSLCSLCRVERFSMTEKVFVKCGKLFPACITGTVIAGEVVNLASQNIPTEVPLKLCAIAVSYEVITVMWHVSYVFFIVLSSFLVMPNLLPHSHTLDAPWQKASTHPQILGVQQGRWLSLVTLPWWVTPPIWTSIVPSLPSTPKIDWWALPSYFTHTLSQKHNKVLDTRSKVSLWICV